MKIEPKLDSGPVMMQSKIRIPEGTNSNILSSIMSKLGSEMIIKSLDLIEERKEEFIPQEEKDATYAKKISKLARKSVLTSKLHNKELLVLDSYAFQ